MPIQPAQIKFDDQGNAYSEAFDDIYFNPNNAAGKTNHLFHRATRFDEKLSQLDPGAALVVGELGFGLGLNFLGTWAKFKQLAPAGSRLHYVGLDVAPPSHEQLEQALSRFVEWSQEVRQLLEEWPGRVAGVHRLRLDRCDLTLHLGDIEAMLPGVEARADAWFLDGFAPEKNPAMWSTQVAQQLITRTQPGGTVGSFTAAGHVRRALADAGFEVERLPGDPFKRHILAAQKPVTDDTQHEGAKPSRRIAVVGAGWAGLSVAQELHRRGHEVVLLDASRPGAGASGNQQAICAPVLDAAPSARQDYYRSAFVLASRQSSRCGVLRKPDTQKDAAALQQAAEVFGDLDGRFAWQDSPEPGLWMPQAGVATFWDFAELVLADLPESACRWPFVVEELSRAGDGWCLRSTADETIQADAVVLACAAATRRFAPTANWPLQVIRGQASEVTATPESSAREHADVGEAYLCPALNGIHSVGATFDPGDTDLSVRPDDHNDNRRRALLTDPDWANAMDWDKPTARVGLRCNTPDYLPMIGPVPHLLRCREYAASLPAHTAPANADWPTLPGLYAVTALGSHGVISSALAASIIADTLDGTPMPCSSPAALAVHPARYLTRAAKRRQPPAYPNVSAP
ncbi:FAD-dependent 5-carboxymethylaminomethyl-2-thiouridine(34) oxidoreductase MnmC [Algisphaera agarilytica]|uniref:tRNA 5-methylaminomethyl-2-thiouridine biosynthesis bifunctional protein n=1 Tax=Algisphaera agarilytica TaxID=1385975 RepID=A0A7X0LLI2_9BACT|nr:FAD-dependent 5-carboxymethylaminomethyl-2-thiouridine(34) oxidoreductase MnmC [Algisphaera agarilytica]MBB6430666.1 tRNA 5-methylaminomethyl-2-thiouridine biosynthesis bifunctional protein [Algisphaera agarilytica]